MTGPIKRLGIQSEVSIEDFITAFCTDPTAEALSSALRIEAFARGLPQRPDIIKNNGDANLLSVMAKHAGVSESRFAEAGKKALDYVTIKDAFTKLDWTTGWKIIDSHPFFISGTYPRCLLNSAYHTTPKVLHSSLPRQRTNVGVYKHTVSVCGSIDFFSASEGWGFELLKDGSNLGEHYSRCLEGRSYHRWIKAGTLRYWLLFYFRTDRPQKPHKGE